jgi:MFS family permease
MNIFLFVTAAITGASILIIEILGAKMLAPYFGTSHFVWTAQIAVTMVALACGYYLGGRLADRWPRLGLLYGAILAASLYLCAATRLCQWMSYQCLNLPLAAGSLLASAILYFPPLTLLAMTGPFFTRVLSVSVQTVGALVGKLSSISTLGSVVGTILIGYILIPFLPNSITMYGTAVILACVSGAYWLCWGRKGPGRICAIAATAEVCLAAFAGIHAESSHCTVGELYRSNSNFGIIQVCQNTHGTKRYYLTDYLCQNTYDPVQKKSISMFSYMLHGLAKAYFEEPTEYHPTTAPLSRIRRVLCIGMGVGIVPMEFAREGAEVDVVEINETVVDIGRRFFDLEPEHLNIQIGDGRTMLNRLHKQYDAIILDAFLGDSSPSHLMSREAFEAMRRLLNTDGVLVINSFCSFEPDRNYLCGSLYKTLSKVFGSVIIHDGGNGNVFFVATPSHHIGPPRIPSLEHVHPSCAQIVKAAFERPPSRAPSAGIVLSDDFNPVDFHDAANRERLRRKLALSMAPG